MAFRKRYPKRRVNHRRTTKRTGFRRKRNYRRVPRGVSTLSNIPCMQKLRYVETIQLNYAGATNPAYYQFRATSLYDPNYTGSGHQPMRYDELTQFYANYIVVGSKITVRHIGNGVNSTSQKIILYTNDIPLSSTPLNDLIEQGRCKWRLTNDNAGKQQDILTQKFSTKKFFNVSNLKDNVARLGATTSASPTDEAFFILAMESADQTTNSAATFLVTIEYLALFSQPIELQSS